MHEIVIIVAGGSGNRMKSDLPKQFIKLNDLPVIMHTINCFYSYKNDIEIRLVLPADQIEFWNELATKHKFNTKIRVFNGGNTRFHSVKNGLEGIPSASLVAIHDGVRPLVSNTTISEGFKAAREKGAAIPIIDVHETIREISGTSSRTVNRENYKLVQTPQVFQSEIILKAYQQEYKNSFTDDASVVESLGHTISLFEGNRENIKITTPNDLLIAKCYLQKEN